MRAVLVLDVKKEGYELSGHFVKVRAPHEVNDSSNPLENFPQKLFSYLVFSLIYTI